MFFRLRHTEFSSDKAYFWDVRLALDGRLLGALDIVESCFLGAVVRSDAATVGWEGRVLQGVKTTAIK